MKHRVSIAILSILTGALFSCGQTKTLTVKEGEDRLAEIGEAIHASDYEFPNKFSFSVTSSGNVEGGGQMQSAFIAYSAEDTFFQHLSSGAIIYLYADNLDLVQLNSNSKKYTRTSYETKEQLLEAFNAYTSPFLLDYSAPIIESLVSDFSFRDYAKTEANEKDPLPYLKIKSSGKGSLSVDAKKNASGGVERESFLIEGNLLRANVHYLGTAYEATDLTYSDTKLHYPDLSLYTLAE